MKIIRSIMRFVGCERFLIPIQCLLVLLTVVFTQGCSVYCAATQPGPCYVERIHVGSSKPEVTAVLGRPKTSGTVEGKQVDTYEFSDGLPNASKSRIVLYVAGDVFTICLAEVIFWPTELALLKAKEGTAVATYNTEEIVTELSVTKRDGSPWVYRRPQETVVASAKPAVPADSTSPPQQPNMPVPDPTEQSSAPPPPDQTDAPSPPPPDEPKIPPSEERTP